MLENRKGKNMADNYLERRMEEHRAGRDNATGPRARRHSNGVAATTAASNALALPGKAVLDFPPRRVLVVGNAPDIFPSIATTFADLGCRVAAISGADSHLAADSRIRHYAIDLQSSESLTTAFSSLLKAWRDVDLVIAAGSTPALPVATAWDSHHSHFPIVTDYGCRLIVLTSGTDASLPAGSSFTVNTVLSADRPLRSILSALMFFALPQAHRLNGLVL